MTEEMYTLDTKIEDVRVSLRLRSGLDAMGCKTLSDARMFTSSQFLRLPNFGRGTLMELEGILSAADKGYLTLEQINGTSA
jgi:DNA-directed RNA polymerase alpha subunit